MSSQQEKINRELKQRPWTYQTFFNRPHWTRRRFFELAGAGVAGWSKLTDGADCAWMLAAKGVSGFSPP